MKILTFAMVLGFALLGVQTGQAATIGLNDSSYQLLNLGDIGTIAGDHQPQPNSGIDVFKFSTNLASNITTRLFHDTGAIKGFDLYRLNESTSALTLLTPYKNDLEKGDNIGLLFSGLEAGKYQLQVAWQGRSSYSGRVEVEPTPLPATLPFLAAGLSGLIFVRRRRGQPERSAS